MFWYSCTSIKPLKTIGAIYQIYQKSSLAKVTEMLYHLQACVCWKRCCSSPKSELHFTELKSHFHGKEPLQHRPCPQPSWGSQLRHGWHVASCWIQLCQDTQVNLVFSTVCKLEAYANPQGTDVQLQVQATLRELAAPSCMRNNFWVTRVRQVKRTLKEFWTWHCGKHKLQPPKPSRDESAWQQVWCCYCSLSGTAKRILLEGKF